METDAASWTQVWEQLQVLIRLYAGHLGQRLSPLNLLSMLTLCLILWLVVVEKNRLLFRGADPAFADGGDRPGDCVGR